MGVVRAIVLGWTHRDRLAVVTICFAVAFFTGTVLVATSVSGQVTAIAADYDSPGAVRHAGDTPRKGDGQVVIVAHATVRESSRVLIGSNPDERRETDPGDVLTFPRTNATLGTARRPSRVTFHGSQTTTVLVRPRERPSALPADWYATNATIVRQFGVDRRYVVTLSTDATTGDVVPEQGTPLRGGFAFFVVGTRSVLELVTVGSVGIGAVVAAIVYSVVRMTVRDRRSEIRTMRAVGATRTALLGLFTGRAVAVTAVGVAAGYAVGVVGTNAAINVAVVAGVPTTISGQVTTRATRLLLVGYGVVGLLAAAAGAIGTWPALRGPPVARHPYASEDDGATSWTAANGLTPVRFRPRLLDWRAFVPTTTALAAFVVLVLVVASAGSALGPLVAGSGTTVSEPGAVHPVASTVPSYYADVLATGQGAASPEILAFSVINGSAVLVRGARYRQFARVSDATLVAGRAPSERHEAVIGEDLARRLGVTVGDRLPVGGSTRTAFTTVEIVGRYRAPGYLDDHLVVSLATARHLTGKPPGTVQFIRLDESISGDSGRRETAQVTAVRVPATVAVGDRVPVTAVVVNPTDERRTVRVPVRIGDRTTTATATVEPFSSRRVTRQVSFATPGQRTITVGNRSTTVRVRPRGGLVVGRLPDRAPPNATLRVRVRTVAGRPAANATVTIGETQRRTNANGVVWVPLPAESGQYTLTVTRGDHTTTEQLRIAQTAQRRLAATWSLPETVTPLTRTRADLVLANPWRQSITRTVRMTGAGRERRRRVSLGPGERRRLRLSLGRVTPGTYDLRATVGGRPVATRSMTVRGDRRLAAAIATHAGTGMRSTGIGRAIATVFGNLQILVGVILTLAGLATVGATTAAFARSVRARYHQLGVCRVVGATRWQLLRLVLGDAVRVGIPAVATAVVLGSLGVFALAAAGLTTVYGIALAVTLSPWALATAVGGSLILVVVGAGLALVPALRTAPVDLVETDGAGDGGGP